MSAPLILLVGAVYLVIAIDLFIRSQSGLALAFAGYSLSNVGLWMATR